LWRESALSSRVANRFVLAVAIVHILIAATEIFLWKLPFVHNHLGFSANAASKVAPNVANASLYNGFLAVGLIWALFFSVNGRQSQVFFLGCVIVAGLFGTATLKDWGPLALQTLPGMAVLVAIRASKQSA
jgi:putative membrane protein